MKKLIENLLHFSKIPDNQDTDAVIEIKNIYVEHSYRDSRQWIETFIEYLSFNS